MLPYLARRTISSLWVLLAVSLAVFIALDAAPGNAADVLVADSGSEQQRQELMRALGLDRPLWERYPRFLAGIILHGDLGTSWMNGRPVTELILERLPATLLLALAAMSLTVLLGATAGLIAAARPGSWLDLTVMGGTLLGLAIPNFWLALLLIFAFGLRLHWLPVTGSGTAAHLVLPAVTLALPSAAVISRFLRASVLDTRESGFVWAGRARGLARSYLLAHYILRNSLIPVITMLGLQFGRLLGGVFIVETIFSWPGLGRLAVQAIFDRDLPVVAGAALVIASGYILSLLIVDLCHLWLDPRLRSRVP
ncbi:MAG: ABC transporter permease [Anaerolineae bacterium]